MPAKKIAPKAALTRVEPKGAYLTKGELTNNLCVESGLSRKQAKAVMTGLTNIGSFELKKRGKFIMPGVARFVVRSKPAQKARQGINPFTKEPCVFKAKPARKVVKAFAVKAFKTL